MSKELEELDFIFNSGSTVESIFESKELDNTIYYKICNTISFTSILVLVPDVSKEDILLELVDKGLFLQIKSNSPFTDSFKNVLPLPKLGNVTPSATLEKGILNITLKKDPFIKIE